VTDCFMADTRHGLAMFPGTEEEVHERIDRIKRKCKDEPDCLVVAKLNVNVSETEFEYMMATRRLPRRVTMRLK
jgi:hypothetical protein